MCGIHMYLCHQIAVCSMWDSTPVNVNVTRFFTVAILVGTLIVIVWYYKSHLFDLFSIDSPMMIFGDQLWDDGCEEASTTIVRTHQTNMAQYVTYIIPPCLHEELSGYEWQQPSCKDAGIELYSLISKCTDVNPVSSDNNLPITVLSHIFGTQKTKKTRHFARSAHKHRQLSKSSANFKNTNTEIAGKSRSLACTSTESDDSQRLFDYYRHMNSRDPGWMLFQKQNPDRFTTLGDLITYTFNLTKFVRNTVRRFELLESTIATHWKGAIRLRNKYKCLVSSLSGLETRYVFDVVMTTYLEHITNKYDEVEWSTAIAKIDSRLKETALIFRSEEYPTLISPEYDDLQSEEHILKTVEFEVASYSENWRHKIFFARSDLSIDQLNASYVSLAALHKEEPHKDQGISRYKQDSIREQLETLKLATYDWDMRLRTLRQQSENTMWSIEGYKFTFSRLVENLQMTHNRIMSDSGSSFVRQYMLWLRQNDVDKQLETLCGPVVSCFCEPFTAALEA